MLLGSMGKTEIEYANKTSNAFYKWKCPSVGIGAMYTEE